MDNTRTPVLYIVGNYNIDLVMGTLIHWPAQGTEMMLEHSALDTFRGAEPGFKRVAGFQVAQAYLDKCAQVSRRASAHRGHRIS